MKRILELVVVLFAFSASGFNNEAWLAKREMLKCEAERLQTEFKNYAAKVDAPAEDMVITLETFPDGSIKSVAKAAKAQFFLGTNYIWVKDVVIQRFEKDGAVAAEIYASECILDQSTNSGWVEGEAKFKYGQTEFSGRGVYFSAIESYLMVLNDSDIKSTDLKFGGLH